MSGIGEEMGDVGLAIQRAEDKTAQMQARAGAIDELIASGALDDVSQVNAGDDIARELDAMSSQSDVEAELARLKGAGRAAGHREQRAEATSCAPSSSARRTPRAAVMIVRILGEGQYDVADDAWTGSTSWTPRSRPPSRPGDEPRVRRRARRAAGRRAHRRAARTTRTRSTSPT